jgi:hypothetical protein
VQPNSPEFKELQDLWYKKLADSGFEDIEQPDGNLKFWASHYFRVKYNATKEEGKQEYYRLAGQFLYDHKFKNKLERRIWELHSIGTPAPLIQEKLMGTRRKKHIGMTRIHNTIRRLAKEMIRTCLKEI